MTLVHTLAPSPTRSACRMMRMSSDTRIPANGPSILQQIARGDPGATHACIERYAGLVWSLARRFTTSDADAEDAVQDIFLDIWKSALRFDPAVASETTFVATIARRRLIDRRRRESRRISTEAMFDEATEPVSPSGPDASATDEMGEDIAAARRALEQLSPDQQRVLQLSIFHGLSHERIARATQIPLGTVKTHARRGLMRIRELIEKDRDTPGPDSVTEGRP